MVWLWHDPLDDALYWAETPRFLARIAQVHADDPEKANTMLDTCNRVERHLIPGAFRHFQGQE